MNIYVIGGSPCSGKSTVAQAISEEYGLHYFKVDDHLDRYMRMGKADNKVHCAAIAEMMPDQIWMRNPQVQCDEELAIYEEISEYVFSDLAAIRHETGIITEGAAYLPTLAKRWRIDSTRYISITPTKDFQVLHYSQREWVPYVLNGCSDKQAAFDNWMERDALFANAAQAQCHDLGYISLINNGECSVSEMIGIIAAHFGLL